MKILQLLHKARAVAYTIATHDVASTLLWVSRVQDWSRCFCSISNRSAALRGYGNAHADGLCHRQTSMHQPLATRGSAAKPCLVMMRPSEQDSPQVPVREQFPNTDPTRYQSSVSLNLEDARTRQAYWYLWGVGSANNPRAGRRGFQVSCFETTR